MCFFLIIAMHRGYLKIWRKIEDSGLMQMPNTFTLFMHILLRASHKPKRLGTAHGVINLERGQYVSGRIALAAELKQSEQQVRTNLSRLENLGILTIKSTSKYSIYTIVNYDKYQDDNQPSTSIQPTDNQQATNKQPTDNQQITTKQECKAFKNEKNVKNKTGADAQLELLRERGIPEQFSKDWIELRKTKKLPLTKTALAGVEREAEKAGLSLEAAIRTCCERGWAGFEASWLLPKSGTTTPAQSSNEQIKEAAYNRLFGGKENATV